MSSARWAIHLRVVSLCLSMVKRLVSSAATPPGRSASMDSMMKQSWMGAVLPSAVFSCIASEYGTLPMTASKLSWEM